MVKVIISGNSNAYFLMDRYPMMVTQIYREQDDELDVGNVVENEMDIQPVYARRKKVPGRRNVANTHALCIFMLFI